MTTPNPYTASDARADAQSYAGTEIPIIQTAFLAQVMQGIQLAAAQGFYEVYMEFPKDTATIAFVLDQLGTLGYTYNSVYDFATNRINYGYSYPNTQRLGNKYKIGWAP